MMKRQRSISLNLWLPLLVLALFVLLFFALSWQKYHDLKRDLHTDSLRFITQEMTFLQREMEQAFRAGDFVESGQALSARGVNLEYQILVAIDDEGEILHATRHALQGKQAGQALPDFDSERSSLLRQNQRPDVHLDPDRQQITAYFPLTMTRRADEISPLRTGTLFLVYDLSETHSEIWSQFVSASLPMGLLLLFTMTVLIGFLRYFVSRPIQHLVTTARALSKGKQGTVSCISGHGELSLLGRAFYEMSKQIEQREQKFQQAEDALIKSEALLSDAGQLAKVGGWELDAKTLEVRWTEETYRIHELPFEAKPPLKEAINFYLPDDRPRIAEAVQKALEHGEPYDMELRFITAKGKHLWVRTNCTPVTVNNKVAKLTGIFQDITEKKQAEERLRLSGIIFESAAEGIIVADVNNNILSVNPAFTKITGYSAEEVTGKSTELLDSGRQDEVFYRAIWNAVETTGHWQGELWGRKKNGEDFAAWLSLASVKGINGNTLQYTSLFIDITKRKENEKKLAFQAFNDPLTQLPNRRLLVERLGQSIKLAIRSNRKAALLFVDLDYFKKINDTFGHAAGDKVLKIVSERLSGCVRVTDTVSRTGGDEFLIVLHDISERTEPTLVAKRVIESLGAPFPLKAQDVFLGASIGISMAPDDGKEVGDLLKKSDIAMYKSKEKGRNTFSFFSEEMERVSKERALLEWDLKNALINQEFLLHFQPIIDLYSLKTVSLEALVRWNHPKRGLVPPDQFIPIAEKSDLISQIGEWVLTTACAQMKQWQTRYGLDTSIAVNMSSREFKYNDLLVLLAKTLKQTGLSPDSLIIEITEGLMLDPTEEAIRRLKAIRDTGVRLSIDDFGTGYSSLSYLSRYPIDLLKIDKSFIQGVQANPQKQPLVEAIVRMGQSMGIKIIAEGVETEEDLSYLMDLGCNEAQGYYYSKPLSVNDYEKVLEKCKVKAW